MSKPKAQGTAWESAFVRKAQEAGLLADRMPEGGMNDAGDVWIGDVPRRLGDPRIGSRDVAVLAWKRLVEVRYPSRRVPDGVPSVVVMSTDDFFTLAKTAEVCFVVECKAAQQINVTRVLANTIRKLANWKAR